MPGDDPLAGGGYHRAQTVWYADYLRTKVKKPYRTRGFLCYGSVRSVPPQLQIGRKTAGGTPRPSGFFTIESPLAPEPQRNILSSQNSGWKIAFDKLDNRVGLCCGLGGVCNVVARRPGFFGDYFAGRG